MKRVTEANTKRTRWAATCPLIVAACLGWCAAGHQARSAEPAPSSFTTKYAHFEPARFSELPGWDLDELTDAWAAFVDTCSALGKRKAWEGPCQRAKLIRAADTALVRGFFEDEVTLNQIQNKNRTPAGVITGYYEPLLTGSRNYGHPYTIPVYARPDDMLYLDSRLLPPDGSESFARVSGRRVIPIPGMAGLDEKNYLFDLGQAKPDIRSKQFRLRIDGDRMVPYYSRGEIVRDGLPRAKIIAWVSSAADFYSMQIQGSGKVRLPNGAIVRLAYDEQNGHPFLPSLRALPRDDSGNLNRLMLAQDTGGAIRGAVRADFIWGFGASAFSQAIRMNEAGKMWLLLPKQQELPGRAGDTTLRGRSIALGADSAECVVPDPELCIE